MAPDNNRNALMPSSSEATIPVPTDPRAALFAKLKAGDAGAFETLMAEVRPELEAFRSRKRFGPADADEVISEVLAKLWTERTRFEGDVTGFRAWVRDLLKQETMTVARRRSRAVARAANEEEYNDLSVSGDPLAGLESDAQSTFLQQRIPKLPASQRLVVLLRLTNHEWDETAWICTNEEGRRVTIDAVRKRYELAVEKLREAHARRH